MRKVAIAAALASTALAGPALARDGAWYVGLDGGAMIVEDIKYDIGPVTGAAVDNALKANHEYGYDVGGIVGYDFGSSRVEFELGYKDAGVDKLQLQVFPPAGFQSGGGSSGVAATNASGTANFNTAEGSTRALSFMVNGLFDFGDDDGWSASVGAGAGIARVKASGYALQPGARVGLGDSDTSPAYQVIAGIRRAISDTVDFGVKYRFFNVESVNLRDANGSRADGRFRSHSLLASLTFNFNEPAPPPPPVAAPEPVAPPPPPPPPPPPAPANPGPFIVFFDWDKSDITPEAAAILDRAAEQFAATGMATVTLAGHADKSGSDRYNVGLSQRRAAAVKTYMEGKGVAGSAITSEAFGESRPLVETADGVREPQNRRVEINFAGGAM
jgi:outer membrane protein OmpA-like peptidoglycan-associated protein